MFVGPAVLGILGVLVIVICQHIPQTGLAWRPYYSTKIEGSEYGQFSEWASFAVTHVGFLLVWVGLLWASLLSDQDGKNFYQPESAWVALSIAGLMVIFGHLALGMTLGKESIRKPATAPQYHNLIPDPSSFAGIHDDGLYHMIRARVWTYMGTMVIPGYVILGVFAAFINGHSDNDVAIVLFLVIIMPLSELGLVMFRTKLIKQYERPLQSKCWGAEGIMATILNICSWFMVAFSLCAAQ